MPRIRIAPVVFIALLLAGAASTARADETGELTKQFETYSGSKLVFTVRELPRHSYFDIMPELPAKRRAAAARIALREAQKYPRGYLGAIGLKAVGIFDGLAAKRGDGYRPFDRDLGGYRYYGMWNGRDATIAAYYSDGQLPLTLHHEIFHHVDATENGATSYKARFASDDARFAQAVAGTLRYRALALKAADQKALGNKAAGHVLKETVSGYAAKSAGEDQAETARYLMTSLPDALLQMARRPKLAGSQRMLHVLAQYQKAAPAGPGIDWFVDVALGRADDRSRLVAAISQTERTMRARIQPQSAFVVWGGEDENGVNWTLRRDLWSFGHQIRTLTGTARSVNGGPAALETASLRSLRLLASYHQHIDDRWTITSGTQRYFDWARAQMTATVIAPPARRRLERASWSELATLIDERGAIRGRSAALPTNRYAHNVDQEISNPTVRRAIRMVQPAAVRLDNGSGVNLTANGIVLTAAHVSPVVGRKKPVLFPDGRRFTATTIAADRVLDIAILKIDGAPSDLPTAPLAAAAPSVGTTAICIGQPGRYTPGGEPTNYQPFHVSVGRIRGFAANRLGPQGLGGTKHDAWTYWGHSGSPIFDARGRIIAMHNSWDSRTAMRHAVTWEALTRFLRRHKVGFETR